MMNEPVHSIMTRMLVTVKPEDSLSTVRHTFMAHSLHHLPVVEDGKLVGIMTTYDMWRSEIAPDDYHTTMASSVMNTNIAKISPNDKIGTAAQLFLTNKFHALPIVDSSNNLMGLVTSFDVLLYQYKKEYPKPILLEHLYENQGSGQRATA